MRRAIPVLSAVLAVQVAFAALLATRGDPLAATTPETPLIRTSLDRVDHLIVEGQPAKGAAADSARIELVKQNGRWMLPGYFDAPADKYKVSDLLSDLAALKRGLPIATSRSAIERFKLADDDFVRRLTLRHGGQTVSTVYVGSSSGVRRSDARTDRDHAVYAVDLASYQLPTQWSDWLDGDVLQREPGSVTELDVATPKSREPLKLVRQSEPAPATANAAAAAAAAAPATASARATTTATAAASTAPAAAAPMTHWVAATLPAGQQLVESHADNLARDVAELHVDAILGTQAQSDWQQDHPLLTLGIRDSQHPRQLSTWTLSAPAVARVPAPAERNTRAAKGAKAASAQPAPAAPSYYILKNSAQPWYFKVSAYSGKQLLDDSAADVLLAAAKAPTAAHSNSPEHAARAHGAHRSRTAG